MTITTAHHSPSGTANNRRYLLPALTSLLLIAAIVGLPRAADAQEQPESKSSLAGVLRKVALDPTTYAPAVLSYDATMRDWNTSQVFFAHGYREWNERFTISGLPNDLPVSYETGRQRILKDTLVTLQISAMHGFASYALEELLVNRYPQHRRLLKTLAIVDRVANASYMSYRLSGQHYQQAGRNLAQARSLGYR